MRTKRKLLVLTIITLIFIALYMTIGLNFSSWKKISFSLSYRFPKLIAIIISAYAIGAATLVFQTIINNRIVTPCLLGMNALYTLLHCTIAVIFGTGSVLLTNKNLSFGIDLVIMSIVASIIYGLLFKATKYNVLYILLIGTVLTSFFGSVQETIVRGMNPSDYDSLLNTLVASFDHVNSDVIIISVITLLLITVVLFKDIRLLNVIALGKNQAVNLGVDYDRTIRRLLLGVVLYIAVATALVGPISFLGLIVANLSRMLLKTYKHKYLIIGTFLFGIMVLVGGQILVQHVFQYSVPVSVFVTIFGGIYFLYLILFKKRSI